MHEISFQMLSRECENKPKMVCCLMASLPSFGDLQTRRPAGVIVKETCRPTAEGLTIVMVEKTLNRVRSDG